MTDSFPKIAFLFFRLAKLWIELMKPTESKMDESNFKALFESLEHNEINLGALEKVSTGGQSLLKK